MCIRDRYELHRLLGALFAEGLTAGERLNIIKEEYDIPIEQTIAVSYTHLDVYKRQEHG